MLTMPVMACYKFRKPNIDLIFLNCFIPNFQCIDHLSNTAAPIRPTVEILPSLTNPFVTAGIVSSPFFCYFTLTAEQGLEQFFPHYAHKHYMGLWVQLRLIPP